MALYLCKKWEGYPNFVQENEARVWREFWVKVSQVQKNCVHPVVISISTESRFISAMKTISIAAISTSDLLCRRMTGLVLGFHALQRLLSVRVALRHLTHIIFVVTAKRGEKDANCKKKTAKPSVVSTAEPFVGCALWNY